MLCSLPSNVTEVHALRWADDSSFMSFARLLSFMQRRVNEWPHTPIGCVSSCRRDSVWPSETPSVWETKVTIFKEWKAACLSTFQPVTAGQAFDLKIEILIPLPLCCLLKSLTLNVSRLTFTSWNKWSALITLYPRSQFLTTFHISCTSLPRQPDIAYLYWN